MNLAAVSRAKATLKELRLLLPDHAGAIDALAKVLDAASQRAGRFHGADRVVREVRQILGLR